MAEGANGGVNTGDNASVLAIPVPQPFAAITDTFPETLPAVTSMVVVPWPEVITQPVGTDQV